MLSVERLIRERYAGLSPALQGAARFLLEHPNEVVVMSMRALAARAGIAPASLVRVARQLGFAGWPELKGAFVKELGLGTEPYGERAKGLLERPREAARAGELFRVQRRNLELTEAQSRSALRRAARLLANAGAVHVAGLRASFPIAYTLVYVYRLFRESVHLVEGLGGGFEMDLRRFERRDALLVISFAPYSSECLRIIEAARGAGCRIVALTDSNASPLSLAADVTIVFSAASSSFFPSIAAGVAAAEALLEMLVGQAGPAAVERIERAEAYLQASGAYVLPPGHRRSGLAERLKRSCQFRLTRHT